MPLIIYHGLHDEGSYVGDPWISKHLKRGHKAHQLVIVGVIVPGRAGDTVFRLELIGIGRVIYDDSVF